MNLFVIKFKNGGKIIMETNGNIYDAEKIANISFDNVLMIYPIEEDCAEIGA